jgi:hypothetical protein
MSGVPDPRGDPPPGWYPDPIEIGIVRWWDGVAWTGYRHLIAGDVPGTAATSGPGRKGRVRTLRILTGLSLLSVPVNVATIVWANRASQGVTPCDAPPTWDQTVLGTWIPLAFVALSLGCLVAAVITYVRTRSTDSGPGGLVTVLVALVGLVGALVSGFFAAFSVAWINVCF